MLALDQKQSFVYREIMIMAWAASVQRTNLYNPAIKYQDRDSYAFRTEVLKYIEDNLLPDYLEACSEAAHIVNIEKLVVFSTEAGGELLSKDGYKLGVAQKLLNLLLKYLWCLGHIAEPPHCPVDRIVIGKTPLREKLNWTEIKSAVKYIEAIQAIKTVAQAQQLSLSKWELQFYSRR
jgi:hypothetical protein